MANEITVVASLSLLDSGISVTEIALAILPPGNFTIATPRAVQNIQSVPTTAGGTAMPMGSVTTPGWALFKNLDVTNYVELLSAVSGTTFARLKAGEVALLRLPPGMTAPAALANTAAVLLQYLILNT
jgi:hypothetical protein